MVCAIKLLLTCKGWWCASFLHLALNDITLKSAMGRVFVLQKSANTVSQETFYGGQIVKHLLAHPWLHWWVDTGILYAALRSDSVGIILNQYSVVRQPRSLQQSSDEYIVWLKVTQPISGRIRILTPDVPCLQRHLFLCSIFTISGKGRAWRQTA